MNPSTETPGQRCYAAYTAALALTFPRPWEGVSPTMQAAWEAAAQAVRTPRTLDTHGCPVCGARDLASRPPGLTEGGEVHRDMTCEDCAATWVTVYTYAETRGVSDTAQAVAPQALETCPRCGQAGPLTPTPPLRYDARVCASCAAELRQIDDDDERTRGQEARHG